MIFCIYYTHLLVMTYFQLFEWKRADFEILALKSNKFHAHTGNSTSGSSYIVDQGFLGKLDHLSLQNWLVLFCWYKWFFLKGQNLPVMQWKSSFQTGD